MPRLEFFYDYGSPYSYLADTRLPALRVRTGCEVVYRPMLLGAVFKATGNRSPAFEPIEARRRYGTIELRRWAMRLAVPFQANPHFPINTLRLMRATHAARQLGVFEAFHAAVYPAFWARGQNLGEDATLVRTLRAAELDADAILAAAGENPAKAELRATTDEALARGVFGAPSFFVGDDMFFGNDRLDFVERALEASG